MKNPARSSYTQTQDAQKTAQEWRLHQIVELDYESTGKEIEQEKLDKILEAAT